MKYLRGISGALLTFVGAVLTLTIATGGYISLGGKRVDFFTTAITANSTTTAAPAGSFAVTTHAT